MPLSRANSAAVPAVEALREEPSRCRFVTVMAAVFFLSGLSSLIYEVVWMRRLALFFGSDVYSAALTLGAFMGGLTLGSLLAARYVDRLRRHLVWYGLLEILIGLYALLFPAFLNLFSGQYRYIYQTFFDVAPWRYNGFRILVAAVTLLIPTTLMGATLPLVVKRFGEAGKVGRYSGFFYAINTLGALSGVLLAGFVLMPLARRHSQHLGGVRHQSRHRRGRSPAGSGNAGKSCAGGCAAVTRRRCRP